MNNIQTLIETAVTDLSTSKSMIGDVSNVVLRQDHDNIANRIALTYLKFARQRQEAARAEKETGTRGNDPLAKPEYMLSYVQQVMNKVCWNARRLFIANSVEDFANGIDFSQDVGEEVGMYVDSKHISEEIDDVFMTLNNLHTWLAGQMSYLTDIDPLFHFAQNEKVGEDWVQTSACTSFDDALSAMNDIVEKLDDSNVIKQREEASSIDFSAAA